MLNYYSDLVHKLSVMLLKDCLQMIKHAISSTVCIFCLYRQL